MSDTPIYDALKIEYAWRSINENLTDWQKQWMEAMNDSYRRVREVFDQASANITAYFAPLYVGGRRGGKLASYYAVIDEMTQEMPEYDADAYRLAEASAMSVAEAQAIIDKVRAMYSTMKAVDWTMAAIKMPPKPPVWVTPNRPHKQLTHQRPQTRALGRTHYHGGRR